MTRDEKASVEYDLCEETFDMWLAERFSTIPNELKPILLLAWSQGWLEGMQRGMHRGASTANKAIQLLFEQMNQ